MLIIALAALLASAAAQAAPVVAVLSADHGVYHRALSGFQAAFGSTVAVRLASVDTSLDPDTRVVIAIGGRAAMRDYPRSVKVIYCLAPAEFAPAGRGSTRVRVVPRPSDLLSHIKLAQPQARVLAALWSQSGYQGYVEALISEGRRAGVRVLSVPTDSTDLPRALSLLQGRANALWLAPDPMLVTPDNFRAIAAFSREQRVAFYAPMAELVEEGATAAIVVTPEEMGRAAAAAAKRDLEGQAADREVFAGRVRVIVDSARAAAAGVILSTDVVGADTRPR